MKHPHENIIKQWLEDTTQEIEFIQLNVLIHHIVILIKLLMMLLVILS
jgi:hypothetical protein